MKIIGEKGIGKTLKLFLQICFYLGAIALIFLPFILNKIGFNLFSSMIVIYPNGIVLLVITYKFIGFFDSLKNNKPFCDENVSIFKTSGIACAISSLLWFSDIFYELIFIETVDIIFYSILIFLCVLFFGFSIAFFILAELFKQATEYKKENDLTI